jgi:hypothetical protein
LKEGDGDFTSCKTLERFNKARKAKQLTAIADFREGKRKNEVEVDSVGGREGGFFFVG